MSCFTVIKKAETEVAKVSFCSDYIVRVMIKKNVDVTAEQFKELFALYNQLCEGEAYPYLYYAEDSSSNITEEARRYAKENEFSFPKVCNAALVTRLAHKLLADFYLKFNKPHYPFKVFSNMDDAERWCLEQYANHQKSNLVSCK